MPNHDLKLLPPTVPANFEVDLDYDPHLQEETLRFFNTKKVSQHIYLNGAQNLVDVVAKLKTQKVPEDKEAQESQEDKEEKKSIPPIPGGILQSCRVGERFVTGAVAAADILTVRRQVESLKAALPVHLHLFNSVPAIRCDPGSLVTAARDNGNRYKDLDGSDVIVGIVDFGCDFRHQNFRQSSGATRILSLWDQNDPADGDTQAKGTPPDGFYYGREFTSEMIDRALASGDDNAYRVLGYTPPPAAHGTHVMDIAAGNGRELNLFNGKPGNLPPLPSAPGVAPHAQIIFVNLKSFETSFLGNSRCLLEAVAYIFKKADELGKPAVVNLSLSTTGGPHDGTTPVEQAFEELVSLKAGRAIVTSAGNAFLMKSHISGKVDKGNQNRATILWNTDSRNTNPDEGVKNEIEIWYPKGKRLNVTLYAPDAQEPVGSVSLGETKELFDGDTRVGRICHREKDPNNEDNHVDLRLPHYDDPGHPWKIELDSEDGEVPFNAWIEQSERGLSRFVGEIDSRCTLGSISCGNGTLTVGAFDTFEKAVLSPPYIQTSAGPIRDTAVNDKKKEAKLLRAKPELSAPGVGIVAARAQGGVTVMTGSSMAAPHVTGLIALLFQLAQKSGRGSLTFAKTCDILTQAVDALSAAEPKEQLGNGRLNGPSAIQKLFTIVVRSVFLDVKVSAKDLTEFAHSSPDANALIKFLNNHTYSNQESTDKVLSFVGFLLEQVKTDNYVRLTMDLLS